MREDQDRRKSRNNTHGFVVFTWALLCASSASKVDSCGLEFWGLESPSLMGSSLRALWARVSESYAFESPSLMDSSLESLTSPKICLDLNQINNISHFWTVLTHQWRWLLNGHTQWPAFDEPNERSERYRMLRRWTQMALAIALS